MDDKQIAEILRRAEEMTKGTDVNLRPTAFKAVFDMLAGQVGGHVVSQPHIQVQAHNKKTPLVPTAAGLIDVIDRSKHPEVPQGKKVLDKALLLLKTAHVYGHEYLSAPEMANILTEKFKVRTSRQAVTQALDGAPTLTNSKPQGRVVLYAIMQSGEDYLAKPESEREKMQFKKSNGKSAKKTKAKIVSSDPKTKPKRSNGVGPKGIVMQLVEEGFFASPRTIGDLRNHIKDVKGHTYATTDLSPALVRLLRDQVLKRTTNSDNQYVYESNKS